MLKSNIFLCSHLFFFSVFLASTGMKFLAVSFMRIIGPFCSPIAVLLQKTVYFSSVPVLMKHFIEKINCQE